MPLTPDELIDLIACLKRDKPKDWRKLMRSYFLILRDMLDPDDPETHATLSQFSESIGRKYFPKGRGMIPFWNQPLPKPEYGTDTEFTA